jgi:hypothetical protein
MAEARTTTSPTQRTTFTTSGSYKLVYLDVLDIQGRENFGGNQTWNLSPASNTWSPDLTPVISSVTVAPNPVTAGQQGTINVVGQNFGVGATLQFSCANDGTNGPLCGGSDLSVPTGGYQAQTSINVNAQVQAAQGAAGNYNVQVVSGGSTGLGFQAGNTGNSGTSRPNGSVPVAPQSPPSLQVTQNGNGVASGGSAWITPYPAMPSLIATLTPAAGTNLAANSQWQSSFVLDTKGSYTWTCTAPSSGQRVLGSSVPWNITAELSGICGGAVSITYSYASQTPRTFTFNVLGQNPDVGAIQSALVAEYPWYSTTRGAAPWFLFQLVNHESHYKQFNNDGTANFGPPNGFGVMQVDPPSSLYQIWDWTENIPEGLNRLNAYNADTFWNQQVQNWQSFNLLQLANGLQTVPAPLDTSEGPCVFSSSPQGSSHPYSDAIWMKRYNTGPNYTPYLRFDSALHLWIFNFLGGDGNDYVGLVCNTPPQ